MRGHGPRRLCVNDDDDDPQFGIMQQKCVTMIDNQTFACTVGLTDNVVMKFSRLKVSQIETE